MAVSPFLKTCVSTNPQTSCVSENYKLLVLWTVHLTQPQDKGTRDKLVVAICLRSIFYQTQDKVTQRDKLIVAICLRSIYALKTNVMEDI